VSEQPAGLLELNNVTVAYGSRMALTSVSLTIEHGSQVAVVGPNGAGKSTLFKAMMGLLPIRTGEM
jgi:ABC-type Mn2+/Zn2+ transport system ATPase subunit